MKYSELNDFYNITEPDSLLPEYLFECIVPRAMSHLAHRQTDFLYMAGEKGKYPVLKEGAINLIHEQVVREMGWLTWEMAYIIADQYYRGIVNMGDEAFRMKEHFGWDFIDWENYPSEDGKIPFEEYEGKGAWSSREAYTYEDEE